jgi:imidazolonepropionase-like amidohydrolase
MRAEKWALAGGTALVGPEQKPITDAVIVADGGRITEVGPCSAVTAPADAEMIDATGLTVLPGFIDAHVHIGFYPPAAVLDGGVTSVRDLGWPPEAIFPLAASSRRPSFAGPSILAAGAMLTAPGGYPTRAAWAPPHTSFEVEGPGAAVGAVDRMVTAGATVIKIALNPPVGPTLDAETLGEIVLAAHAHALKVTGHVHGLEELTKALNAEVDELAHMLLGTEAIDDDTLARMVDQDMAVVPTLAIRSGHELDVAVKNLRNFRKAGGRVLYGTDLGNAGTAPGIDANEVAFMAASGMTPAEVIGSATSRSADWLQLPSAGLLEVGRHADVIAVRGDPLRDLHALRDIEMVFRRGRRAR